MGERPAYKSIDQKVKGDPFNPDTFGEIVKPAELVDIIELRSLTLADRRIYNSLVAHAWDMIEEGKVHRIAKSKLKGKHYGNERLEDSIVRLMGTVAQSYSTKAGKPSKQRFQLLGPNEEEIEEEGFLYYRFPEELVKIISKSEVWARLKSHVMFCFQSKYALCLYEMIERRKGLEYTQKEIFSLEDLRRLLNVPDGKLTRYADFNKYVLKVAQVEVNQLCEFSVHFDPIKEGRSVAKIQVVWLPKTKEGRSEAFKEVERHQAGRRARRSGNVEEVAFA